MSPSGGHAWLPRASCDVSCVGHPADSPPVLLALRVAVRLGLALLLAPGVPLLFVLGRPRLQRAYCRAVLRCFGVRIMVSGNPIRNLSGVLVVSNHMSWLDVFAIGAVLPGSFVARADMFSGRAIAMVARLLKIIPIERASLRRLPAVVGTVGGRLRAGQTVVAFPEGTTWCGLASGSFYPAMFQAAIDAGRPVQPLRLTYHHVDGTVSTTPAYVGQDTLARSVCRVLAVRRTVTRVHVGSLQLPGTDRRALARRCQLAVHQRSQRSQHPAPRQALAA
ncbi:lysophospholipid acyltransferase family protein [Mycobacterium kansasii]|uniref:2-acyl-glycerophospho-ethanolamine acyltransferase n=1 Tax=Mycobacterium kansasii TaxID=1768 RepID=A0A653EJF3_MYCKA|nr:1-acyl-sn-glycerol-3-phosphate acyltransferase [Mycobacterium kansasii]ARG60886.1 1-acyl-sn-glycerol-3-phosphate acyltransferase [Mycobacterium kansasii]ARG68581.1 1-acyl-sn-glycerol-3-phosphate acyltransferase [Mycobacterium kansasii]ARG76782.1 1-acyl-sn-glycerol-3-phosphate acyltransferase [Mycobacterium kansasii]ARG82317.1 1-acyl-sn-glycerol-3-phosphate acyltransferase [Mycobacterium kansasii]